MALKAVVSKAEFDALAEPIRKEYAERDNGEYALTVEGLPDPKEFNDLKVKVADFRDNNRKLFSEVEQLRPLKERYKDIDPDKYKELESEVEQFRKRGVNKPEDLAATIATEVQKATKSIQERLDAEAKARQEAQQRMRDSEFEKQFTDAAVKAGIRQNAVGLVIPKARAVFELTDNGLAPKEGIRHPTEPHKDLTPQDWLQELAKTDDYLFQPSEGSGGGGGDTKRRGGPAGRTLINPSSEEMGRNLDKLASGEMKVVRPDR